MGDGEKKEIKGLRDNPDTLRIGLETARMRSARLGIEFTVGAIARLGVELLYEGELEILRLQANERAKEKVDEMSSMRVDVMAEEKADVMSFSVCEVS